MFTTDLGNQYNRNIFKKSLYIYIFQDEKCRHMRNLSLSMLLYRSFGLLWLGVLYVLSFSFLNLTKAKISSL